MDEEREHDRVYPVHLELREARPDPEEDRRADDGEVTAGPLRNIHGSPRGQWCKSLRDYGAARLKAASVVLSLRSSGGARNTVVDALHIIRDEGSADPRLDPGLSEGGAARLSRGVNLQRILDNRMLALQRQGRIGFYGPSLGQEAAIVGAGMAMEPEDWIVPQYREPGAALVHGMPLKELLCQLIGNSEDPVHGRQMPCHYVYRKGNYLSISSPVGTQI